MKTTKVFWDGKRCVWVAKYLDTKSGYKVKFPLGRPDDPATEKELHRLALEAAPAPFRDSKGWLKGNFEIEEDILGQETRMTETPKDGGVIIPSVEKALCAQIDALKARVAELEKKPECHVCGDEIESKEFVCHCCIGCR